MALGHDRDDVYIAGNEQQTDYQYHKSASSSYIPSHQYSSQLPHKMQNFTQDTTDDFAGSSAESQFSSAFHAQYAAMQQQYAQIRQPQTSSYTLQPLYSGHDNSGSSSAFQMGDMSAALPASSHTLNSPYQVHPMFPGQHMAHQQISPSQTQPAHSPQHGHMFLPSQAQSPVYSPVIYGSGQQYPHPLRSHGRNGYFAPYIPHAGTPGFQQIAPINMQSPPPFEEQARMIHQGYPQFSPLQQPRYNQNYTMMASGNRPPHHGLGKHSGYSSGLGFQDNVESDPASPAMSRGPPRKPRQSGHALWVGNLAPGVSIVDLKDYFSRGATKDIESVKLISKSNCAFVNYRDATTCASAMSRFHESHFMGTRLVCRLRKTMPSTGANSDPYSAERKLGQDAVLVDGEAEAIDSHEDSSERRSLQERFFVLKSLTLRDLEVSLKTRTWATQAHNENALDDAFKSAQTVYLIFSANKSGEYFGYAKMTSPITAIKDERETSEKKAQSPSQGRDADEANPSLTSVISSHGPGPRVTSTPATQWAPKGKIIDDSARGAIFWEADDPETTTAGDNENETKNDTNVIARSTPEDSDSTSVTPVSGTNTSAQSAEIDDNASGNYFHIEWISTRRVAFYKTRALRNPWNSNREVKIARDGTELETEVGMRVVSLFGGAD